MSVATARKQVLDDIADRLLAQRAEDEAAAAAEVDVAKAADDQARAAFHTYLSAREDYALAQQALVEAVGPFAAVVTRAAEARTAQDEALRAAQKLDIGDLPEKHMELAFRAVRDQAASDALAALNTIGRRRV